MLNYAVQEIFFLSGSYYRILSSWVFQAFVHRFFAIFYDYQCYKKNYRNMLLIFIRSGISLPVLSFDMLLIQQKISIPAVIPMIIIFFYNSTE